MKDRVEWTVSVLLTANKTRDFINLIDRLTEHIYSSGLMSFGRVRRNTTLVSINSRYFYLHFSPQFPHHICLTGLENFKMEYCKIAFI